jgi:hypothetical protein
MTFLDDGIWSGRIFDGGWVASSGGTASGARAGDG